MTVKNNGDLKVNFKPKELRLLLFFAIMKLPDILKDITIFFAEKTGKLTCFTTIIRMPPFLKQSHLCKIKKIFYQHH